MKYALHLVLCYGLLLGCSFGSETPQGRIVTEDVFNFVKAYELLEPSDTACTVLDRYFEKASGGLAAFPRIAGTREDLCGAIRSSPRRYAEVAAKAEQLDPIRPQLERVYHDFEEFFGSANLLDTYVVVGRGWWGGTVRKGRIYIGLEVIDSDAVACLVAHELGHAHQSYPTWRILTRGGFLKGTVLAQSIEEGTASLVAHIVTGCSPDGERHEWAEEREAQLWEEFQRDMNGRDYSMWIYNGANRGQLGERPHDLGYFMGYKIAESYYERAADKREAIREMLTIRNFSRFLERSGYAGGGQDGGSQGRTRRITRHCT
jgi:hypothetical protein